MTTNPLAMSDEEFLALGDAALNAENTEGNTAESKPAEEETPAGNEEGELTEAEKAAAAQGEEGEGAPSEETPNPEEPKATEDQAGTPEPKPEEQAAEGGDKPADAPAPKEEKPAATGEPVDYEGFYTQIMAPFKANGKMIELKSPDEAIRLMQQGANYTRKMQELAPHRRVLMMLEKSGLLDESKLEFLIDIEKRDPAAIQKLVKESGLDPMDIDVSKESTYRGGTHRVGDDEMKFRTALDDLKSTPAGLETLQVINTQWDDASKDHLWASPEAMATIHAHRELGLYDRINSEVDRRKTLGTIAAEVPFLQAYRLVGEEMANNNEFADVIKPAAAAPASTPTPAAAPKVVATRVAAPKPTVVNSDKAAAASTSRSTPPKGTPFINPLAMSDEEFMKQAGISP